MNTHNKESNINDEIDIREVKEASRVKMKHLVIKNYAPKEERIIVKKKNCLNSI